MKGIQRVAIGSHDQHEGLVLENQHVRAIILPKLGGRVWELYDRKRTRQWIWHRDTVPLAAVPPGSAYDDVWAGGWEELFPNDAPGTFEGRFLPDHGEWWTMEWDATNISDPKDLGIRLTASAPMAGARCTKQFQLPRDGSTLKVSYRIESLGAPARHFLFKQHLPIAITPRCTLALPGGRVTAVDPTFGNVLPGPGPFTWPTAGDVDLRRVPPRSSRKQEFVYLTGLPESWCGVVDTESGASLRMTYDGNRVPYLWLFLSYGGWRDCYTAVLEPCTNLPKDLSEAVRLGQSALLAAHGSFETSVAVTLGGLDQLMQGVHA